MKYLQLFSFLILYSTYAFSQSKYNSADSIAVVARASTIEVLHKELTQNLSTDEEKLRAFYFWITHNINYDVNEWVKPSLDFSRQQPVNVLRNKKAVCHGYSELFKALCDLSGIKCYLVSGYTKRYNILVNEGHTWNVVHVNNQWLPVDATWGAGGVDEKRKFIKSFEEKYFLADPKEFLTDHYPFDPMWQLMPFPVSLNNYRRQTWKYEALSYGKIFNYADTISNWELNDSIGQRLTAAQRMIRMNPDDIESKKELSYALMDQAQEESIKGSAILSELYPKTKNQQTTATRKNLPKDEFNSQLEKAYRHFSQADSILKKVAVYSQRDRNDKENALKILKHNMNVIQSERQR